MFPSLELFVFGWLFLTVKTQTGRKCNRGPQAVVSDPLVSFHSNISFGPSYECGSFHELSFSICQILPPKNVSLLWIDDFETKLSWAPPPPPVSETNCNMTYQVHYKTDTSGPLRRTDTHELKHYQAMNGSYLHISIKTICNGKESEAKAFNITYPALVGDLQCHLFYSRKGSCSWNSPIPVSDLRVFYRTCKEEPLVECVQHITPGEKRTMCELNVSRHTVMILFNGTVNNSSSRNTFEVVIDEKVFPPPLNWTVTKTGNNFNISWIPPDFEKMDWKFKLNYTECGIQKILYLEGGRSHQLPQIPHCEYRMVIMAESTKGGTPWSDEIYFGADTDPNSLVYIVIIIPVLCAVLAILTFVCCRKNRKHIFPKVPEPRDFLSDISDNNYKCTVYDLYIPATEEENCTIILEREVNKPDN